MNCKQHTGALILCSHRHTHSHVPCNYTLGQESASVGAGRLRSRLRGSVGAGRLHSRLKDKGLGACGRASAAGRLCSRSWSQGSVAPLGAGRPAPPDACAPQKLVGAGRMRSRLKASQSVGQSVGAGRSRSRVAGRSAPDACVRASGSHGGGSASDACVRTWWGQGPWVVGAGRLRSRLKAQGVSSRDRSAPDACVRA